MKGVNSTRVLGKGLSTIAGLMGIRTSVHFLIPVRPKQWRLVGVLVEGKGKGFW